MTNVLLEAVRDFWKDVEETFLLELKQRDPKIPVLIEYDDTEKPQTNFYLLDDTEDYYSKDVSIHGQSNRR
jgi:hypothetical protein